MALFILYVSIIMLFNIIREDASTKINFYFDLFRLRTSLILLNPYSVCKFKKLFVTTSYKQKNASKTSVKR